MSHATISAAPNRRDDSSLEALRARFGGEIITPDSSQYDAARMVQNTIIDRRPLAVARAINTEDVANVVRFVREHGRTLAVRSGGHSFAGHSTVDDGIVLDLSRMKGITIDPAVRTARVQPGVTSGDFAGPAHAYGLALSTGDTSSVGFGGLTTGGGIGYMVRKYALAIDNLLSAKVVTADGAILTASANENPDLFWGIRGGGGNFGVITEFEFRLAPVGQILGGMLALPATPEVVRGYLDYIVEAPEDLTTISEIMGLPPAPFVPEEKVGQVALAVIVSWSGGIADGEKALAPLRALAEPVVDVVEPMPYPAIYAFSEEASNPMPSTHQTMFARSISDASIEAMIDAANNASSPIDMVQLRGFGGKMAVVGADETAFAHRDAKYLVGAISIWEDAAEDIAPHKAWVESLWGKIRHDASGNYVNFVVNEGDEGIRAAYPAATYDRLVQLKRKYDPTNLFRLNQNIRPD